MMVSLSHHRLSLKSGRSPGVGQSGASSFRRRPLRPKDDSPAGTIIRYEALNGQLDSGIPFSPIQRVSVTREAPVSQVGASACNA